MCNGLPRSAFTSKTRSLILLLLALGILTASVVAFVALSTSPVTETESEGSVADGPELIGVALPYIATGGTEQGGTRFNLDPVW